MQIDDNVLISPIEYEKLKSELVLLETKDRHDLLEQVRDEYSQADIDAPYHNSARWQLDNLDQKIAYLKQKLERAKTFDHSISWADVVGYGSTVKIHNAILNEDVQYAIVSVTTADPAANRVGLTSKIGKALVGKKTGDFVELETSNGVNTWQIIEVQ